MLMISDERAIGALVDAVLAANPQQLAQYRAGKVKLMVRDAAYM